MNISQSTRTQPHAQYNEYIYNLHLGEKKLCHITRRKHIYIAVMNVKEIR